MVNNQKLRFHWSLSQAGQSFRRAQASTDQVGRLSFDDQLRLCQLAEENHIESVLMAIGFTRPDPLSLSIALGMQTKKINFLVAVRSGLISPTYFVQQLNTASTLLGDRLAINVVNGHSPAELKFYGDETPYEKRFDRSNEFMEVCHAYWQNSGPVNFEGEFYNIKNGVLNTPYLSTKGRPEVYMGGNSENSIQLAKNQGDCLWIFPSTTEKVREAAVSLASAGKELGILVSLITRPTREEAELACKELLKNFDDSNRKHHADYKVRYEAKGFTEILDQAFLNRSNWITPCLWTGAVPYMGAPSIALVGSYAEVANELMEYKNIGVSQFLFMGWPDEEEIEHFGKGVYPLTKIVEEKQCLELA